jgi:hypothetical protein
MKLQLFTARGTAFNKMATPTQKLKNVLLFNEIKGEPNIKVL